MTQPVDTQEADVAQLKARRKAPVKQPARTALSAPQPPPASPSSMGNMLRRQMPVLFDPAEIPLVVSSSGIVPDATLENRYDRAESAYTEIFTPNGCTTPVAVLRWPKGAWVRKDVYAKWCEENVAPEENEAATQE